jgi:hypothetical protein
LHSCSRFLHHHQSSGLALIGWKHIWFMWVLDLHHRR